MLGKRKDEIESRINEARNEAYAFKELAEQVFDTEEMRKQDFADSLAYNRPSLDRLIELQKRDRRR